MLSLKLGSFFVLAVSSFLLLSCNNVSVPDFWSCVPITEDYGYCRKALTESETIVDNNTRKLNEKTWIELQENAVILPEESFAELEKFILKVCEKTKECDVPKTQNLFQQLKTRGQNDI